MSERVMLAIGGNASAGAVQPRPAARARAGAATTAPPSRGLRSLLAAGMLSVLLLGLGVAAARAELAYQATYGSEGSGDGQFFRPRGIGVDQTLLTSTSGDIYVADSGNARIEQFDSAGNFLSAWGWGVADGASSLEVCTSACRAGAPGKGAGQFEDPTSIAVDNSSGPSQGDVYVGDLGADVVYKFSPSGSLLATIAGPTAGTQFGDVGGVAVDTNGNLWVADSTANDVYEFDSSGTLLTKFGDTYSATEAIAVDANDNVYLIRGAGETERWNASARASGGGQTMFDSSNSTGLAVDFSTNDVYVDLGSSIDEREASDKSLGNFGSGWLTEGAQMAYNPNISLPGAGNPGALYVADRGSSKVTVFAPPAPAAPVVQPGSESGTSVTAKAATLEAKVNAEGVDTHVYFEYGPTTAYGTATPAPPGSDIGSNFAFLASTASLSGLSSGTTYHFRVVAANAQGTTYGPDATFTTGTPTAPTVSGESAASISATKATLQATVNPQLADTRYVFEYGPTAAYGTTVPLPPGTDVGESGEQSATAALTGLQPSTTYHFRLVATNAIGTTDGSDATFTTAPSIEIYSIFAANVTATAADLMAKVNTEDISAQYHFEYGTTTSYGAVVPVPDASINAAEGEQSVAVHLESLLPSTKYYFRLVTTNAFGTETGSPASFTTYATGESPGLPDNRGYELVSPTDKNGGDVGGGALNNFAASAFGRSSLGGAAIEYSSLASFAGAQSAGPLNEYVSSRGSSGWVTQALSPPIAKHTGLFKSLNAGYRLFTPELTTGILSWEASPLTAGAPEGAFPNLYRRQLSTSEYELLTTVAPPSQTKEYEMALTGASADLSHVVFDANAALVEGAKPDAWNVYEWDAGSLQLISVLPGPEGVAAEEATAGNGKTEETGAIQENAISADGSRVFWTGDSGQLYVRENGTTTVQINESQRTPSLGDGSARFQTATPDGSRVFFTDTTQLTNSPDDNGGLYEYDLASGKLTDLSPDSGGAPEVAGVIGAGENGLSVYFVARASLVGAATAGADNLYLSRDGSLKFIGTLSSEDSEDWSESLTTRRARVTPSGEYLAFLSQASLTGYDNVDAKTGKPDNEVFVYDAGSEQLSCASCNPSGARPVGSATVPKGEYSGHVPRFISDDGRRVFFDSEDVLSPADTNGQQNVYEYENGAIYLISPGTSEGISSFVDADENGNNLFFATRAPLVPEDTDEGSDLYDARVDGGFPARPSSPEPCAGENCRGALSAPPAPLGIGSETNGSSPEGVPAQPEAVAAPTPGQHGRKLHGHKIKRHASNAKRPRDARHRKTARRSRRLASRRRPGHSSTHPGGGRA